MRELKAYPSAFGQFSTMNKACEPGLQSSNDMETISYLSCASSESGHRDGKDATMF